MLFALSIYRQDEGMEGAYAFNVCRDIRIGARSKQDAYDFNRAKEDSIAKGGEAKVPIRDRHIKNVRPLFVVFQRVGVLLRISFRRSLAGRLDINRFFGGPVVLAAHTYTLNTLQIFCSCCFFSLSFLLCRLLSIICAAREHLLDYARLTHLCCKVERRAAAN